MTKKLLLVLLGLSLLLGGFNLLQQLNSSAMKSLQSETITAPSLPSGMSEKDDAQTIEKELNETKIETDFSVLVK